MKYNPINKVWHMEHNTFFKITIWHCFDGAYTTRASHVRGPGKVRSFVTSNQVCNLGRLTQLQPELALNQFLLFSIVSLRFL